MKRVWYVLCLALTLFVANSAWADQMDFLNQGTNSSPSFISLLAKLILAMVLIVGLIYLSMYLLKKFSYSAKKKIGGSDIEVLQRGYIAPKKGIYLVKVQSKVLVLGVTDTNVNYLTELPEIVEEEEKSKKPYPDPAERSKKFSELMQEMKGKFDSLWHKREKDAVEVNS